MLHAHTRDILNHILTCKGLKANVRNAIATTLFAIRMEIFTDKGDIKFAISLIDAFMHKKKMKMPFSFMESLLKNTDRELRFKLLNSGLVEAGMHPKHFEKLFREVFRKKEKSSLERGALAAAVSKILRFHPETASKYHDDVEVMMCNGYPREVVGCCISRLPRPTITMLDYLRENLRRGTKLDRTYAAQYWRNLFCLSKGSKRKQVHSYLIKNSILPLLQRLARDKDRQHNYEIAQQGIDEMFEQFPDLRPKD